METTLFNPLNSRSYSVSRMSKSHKTLTSFLLCVSLFLNLICEAQGPGFQWAKTFSGNSNEYGRDIACDLSGNVYTIGYFKGTVDFDPGPGTLNFTCIGNEDVFISKLDASGNFVWAKQLGNVGTTFGISIDVDQSGNLLAIGYYGGTLDADPGTGTFNLTAAGQFDAFVLKLNASGNFVWAKSMGGTMSDYGSAIDVDATGNVYCGVGFISTADFDPGAGTFNLTSAGLLDNAIVKLDPSGNFIWAKRFGSVTCDDYTNSLFIDPSGNVFTAGRFCGTVDFDPGAATFNLTSTGNYDMFVSKLDASGNFVWAVRMGGSGPDSVSRPEFS